MGRSHGMARKLKALQVNLEGLLTLDGEKVSAVPIGRPNIVFSDEKMRREGYLRHGMYGDFEETTKIPEDANAYVLGNRACEDYAPIQFYKIKK